MTPPGMLEGLRVLDLSRIIAGPYCAMLLGDLGADVIKLERPGRGDDLRSLRGASGMSAIFAAANRNKRGIAIDLVRRFRTGEGQHLDVNLLASMLAMLPDPVANYFDAGVRPGREGNRNPYLTPAEAFRTGDGYLTVVITGPEQWGRFCEGLGDRELVSHPKFATNPDRLANHAEFKARVETRLATAPTAEWVQRFEAVSIAAGPIYEFDEVFADPHVRHLGLLTEIEQPGYGRLRMLDFPFAASATPARITRPAPLLGQHTGEVLEELGLPGPEIERLAAAGAIQLGAVG